MLGAMAIFGMISLIFFSISRSQSSKYNTEKKEIMSQLIELVKVPEDKLKPLISQASRENYVIKYAETKELKGINEWENVFTPRKPGLRYISNLKAELISPFFKMFTSQIGRSTMLLHFSIIRR